MGEEKNTLTLRGGMAGGWGHTVSAEGRAPARLRARAPALLGGIAAGLSVHRRRTPAQIKLTWNRADGQREEKVLKDGTSSRTGSGATVPSSGGRRAGRGKGELRTFAVAPGRPEAVVASSRSRLRQPPAPTFVALTARSPGAIPFCGWRRGWRVDGSVGNVHILPMPGLRLRRRPATTSARWFAQEDAATLAVLRGLGYGQDRRARACARRSRCSCCAVTSRSPIGAARGALRLRRRGGGLVLVHPALWYNWATGPNTTGLAGAVRAATGLATSRCASWRHPIPSRASRRLTLADRLYRFEPDRMSARVLALGTS
jgi:hypothetical protein